MLTNWASRDIAAASDWNSAKRLQLVMINPRKLVSIDIVFLGLKLISAEFAVGVLVSIGLGTFLLLRGHSHVQLALALYLISLGII
jgi:hypothetical protein